mmetsp:Transcript_23130/g.74906  ORF Transcript_23130/g.74906 Transcript_23130/m.74906 type:complete len:245 (-) Transcript_23130:1507-2241(-)
MYGPNACGCAARAGCPGRGGVCWALRHSSRLPAWTGPSCCGFARRRCVGVSLSQRLLASAGHTCAPALLDGRAQPARRVAGVRAIPSHRRGQRQSRLRARPTAMPTAPSRCSGRWWNRSFCRSGGPMLNRRSNCQDWPLWRVSPSCLGRSLPARGPGAPPVRFSARRSAVAGTGGGSSVTMPHVNCKGACGSSMNAGRRCAAAVRPTRSVAPSLHVERACSSPRRGPHLCSCRRRGAAWRPGGG